jgi:hypothetical protein
VQNFRRVCTELQRDEKGRVCLRVTNTDVTKGIEHIMVRQDVVRRDQAGQ